MTGVFSFSHNSCMSLVTLSLVYRGKEAARLENIDPQVCTVGDVVAAACAGTRVDAQLLKVVGLWRSPRPPAPATPLAQLQPPVRWKRPVHKLLVFGVSAGALAEMHQKEQQVSDETAGERARITQLEAVEAAQDAARRAQERAEEEAYLREQYAAEAQRLFVALFLFSFAVSFTLTLVCETQTCRKDAACIVRGRRKHLGHQQQQDASAASLSTGGSRRRRRE